MHSKKKIYDIVHPQVMELTRGTMPSQTNWDTLYTYMTNNSNPFNSRWRWKNWEFSRPFSDRTPLLLFMSGVCAVLLLVVHIFSACRWIYFGSRVILTSRLFAWQLLLLCKLMPILKWWSYRIDPVTVCSSNRTRIYSTLTRCWKNKEFSRSFLTDAIIISLLVRIFSAWR